MLLTLKSHLHYRNASNVQLRPNPAFQTASSPVWSYMYLRVGTNLPQQNIVFCNLCLSNASSHLHLSLTAWSTAEAGMRVVAHPQESRSFRRAGRFMQGTRDSCILVYLSILSRSLPHTSTCRVRWTSTKLRIWTSLGPILVRIAAVRHIQVLLSAAC